jgi:hypothetical protein
LNSLDKNGIEKREYAYLSGTASPQSIPVDPSFAIKSTIREWNLFTIVKVRFTASIDIPAGYDTSNGEVDPLKKNPIGYIEIRFNTIDFVNNGFSG